MPVGPKRGPHRSGPHQVWLAFVFWSRSRVFLQTFPTGFWRTTSTCSFGPTVGIEFIFDFQQSILGLSFQECPGKDLGSASRDALNLHEESLDTIQMPTGSFFEEDPDHRLYRGMVWARSVGSHVSKRMEYSLF